MSGVNKVIIVGRLGRDPELRYLQNGNPVCKLNVATSEKYTNKDHQLVETTEWHRVTIWGKPAENANNFLAKGSLIYVEGKLKTTSYDKDGQKHWVTEIVATNTQYLSTKAENNKNRENSEQESSQNQNQGQKQKPNKKQSENSEPPGSDEMPDFNDFGGNPGDDDIPF